MIQIVLYYHLNHSCNIATNFPMFSNNYHYIQLNYTLALQHLCVLHYLFEYYLFHLCSLWMNGTQFLNIISLCLSSNRLTASLSPAPVVGVVSVVSCCCMLVWFWHQISSSPFCCYKFNVSMFSYIFHSFPKNCVIY